MSLIIEIKYIIGEFYHKCNFFAIKNKKICKIFVFLVIYKLSNKSEQQDRDGSVSLYVKGQVRRKTTDIATERAVVNRPLFIANYTAVC